MSSFRRWLNLNAALICTSLLREWSMPPVSVASVSLSRCRCSSDSSFVSFLKLKSRPNAAEIALSCISVKIGLLSSSFASSTISYKMSRLMGSKAHILKLTGIKPTPKRERASKQTHICKYLSMYTHTSTYEPRPKCLVPLTWENSYLAVVRNSKLVRFQGQSLHSSGHGSACFRTRMRRMRRIRWISTAPQTNVTTAGRRSPAPRCERCDARDAWDACDACSACDGGEGVSVWHGWSMAKSARNLGAKSTCS